ncbi:unnamed protein product [Penicillium roqueforti FM164]|uniref:Genomic scaffold, ProqFM164S04 n=1 Tax=Penicillium roqueforti (strain FM164) TaxID=1365484 RepID=W6QF02_PENRF|nr:unnamed protein product [Penicillium roqueforti FM164]
MWTQSASAGFLIPSQMKDQQLATLEGAHGKLIKWNVEWVNLVNWASGKNMQKIIKGRFQPAI